MTNPPPQQEPTTDTRFPDICPMWISPPDPEGNVGTCEIATCECQYPRKEYYIPCLRKRFFGDDTKNPQIAAPEQKPSCNNCYHTKCGYACDIPCGDWKLRPYPVQIQELKTKISRLEQKNLELVISKNEAARAAALAAYRDFDYWFSGRHVGGQSPIIPEVRVELHRRIESLRITGDEL